MDIRALLNFVSFNVESIFGVTLVLFFGTSAILLFRSLGEKKSEVASHPVSSSEGLDVRAIEGAMKRVLASQPVSVVATAAAAPAPVAAAPASSESAMSEVSQASSGAGGGSGADPEVVAAMQSQLDAREKQINDLETKLEFAKTDMEKLRNRAVEESADSDVGLLQTKIDELTGRLMEYEIIEDDIADLSLFKEENAKLKAEVEQLKARLEAGAAVAAVPVAAPAAPVESEIAKASAPGPSFEKAERFELDPNDDVMKEFAAAVSFQRAPPPDSASSVPPEPVGFSNDSMTGLNPQEAVDAMLASTQESVQKSVAEEAVSETPSEAPTEAPPASSAALNESDLGDLADILGGAPDPEKMLSEAAALMPADGAIEATGSPAASLEESLDTDKLLAEVTELKPAKPEPKPIAPEDDLLAEFKDGT